MITRKPKHPIVKTPSPLLEVTSPHSQPEQLVEQRPTDVAADSILGKPLEAPTPKVAGIDSQV